MTSKRSAFFIGSWMAQLQRFCDRAWYLPLVSFLAAADLFILVIPTDGLMVASVLLRRRRWLPTALFFTAGSVLGSVALALAIQTWGEPLVVRLLGDTMASASWARAADLVSHYGGPALLLFAASPLPLQPPVALCTLAHMPILQIGLLLLAGRLFKFVVLGWVASRAPALLARFRFFSKEVVEAQEASMEASMEAQRDSINPRNNP